ncbi:hypothetical protein DH2020_004958 [Rehmannia glutinosa]|uniref:Reverse transcriptase Ty1/copia-type domain-containing protein n=1 Tax=Rehmannia glutinosa TaxID=99300 RepID=A0ABR0XQU5_REHGL
MKTELDALERNNTWILTTLPPNKHCIDSSLFVQVSEGSIVILCIYVDDIILASNSFQAIENTKQHLDNKFTIKDLGTLKYILGIEVARNKQGIHLCQRKYALDLINETGYTNCKPSITPMDSKLNFINAYSIQTLSQFLSKPTFSHLAAAHRVLRYIKTSPVKGLFYSANSALHLKGFRDADWARCPYTRRSISGYVVYLGDSVISWKTTVSRSPAEAEYRDITLITCEIQWLTYLLQDLQVNRKIQEGLLKLLCIPSAQQNVDILTKPLPCISII